MATNITNDAAGLVGLAAFGFLLLSIAVVCIAARYL